MMTWIVCKTTFWKDLSLFHFAKQILLALKRFLIGLEIIEAFENKLKSENKLKTLEPEA